LGILEHKKDIDVIIPLPGNICCQLIRSLSLFHILSTCFCHYIWDGSSFTVCVVAYTCFYCFSASIASRNSDSLASKLVWDFRYVYTHRPKVPASQPVPTNSSPVDGPPQPSTFPSDLDISIALRKGKQSYTDHPISNFVSYDHLNLTFRQFALSFGSIPRSYTEALLVPAWKQAMDEKMDALASRGIWELVSTPTVLLLSVVAGPSL